MGESQSLGSVNIQIQCIQGQVRTLRDALESRYCERLTEESPIIPWMIMHAAGILNKFRVGVDGRTACQRVKGRALAKALAEFGECVWYLKPKTAGINKADVRWDDGVWLGIHDNSGEVYMGTRAGVIKVRTIRRKGIKADR